MNIPKQSQPCDLAAKIRARYQSAVEQVEKALSDSKRKPGSARIIVVTKAQPVEVLKAAFQAGLHCFGENYPEETLTKIETMKELPGIEWHMIGHLQTRKIPIVVNHFSMLHSLDSVRLAERLNLRLVRTGKTLPVLIEINVGDETSKYGFKARNSADLESHYQDFEKIMRLENLEIKGLMTMPPLFDDPEQSRPYFKRLYEMRAVLAQKYPEICWEELSMGTSADYAVAVQEGATYVRIGQAIVGPRPARI